MSNCENSECNFRGINCDECGRKSERFVDYCSRDEDDAWMCPNEKCCCVGHHIDICFGIYGHPSEREKNHAKSYVSFCVE